MPEGGVVGYLLACDDYDYDEYYDPCIAVGKIEARTIGEVVRKSRDAEYPFEYIMFKIGDECIGLYYPERNVLEVRVDAVDYVGDWEFREVFTWWEPRDRCI
jgi:hypothetical protein